MVELLAPAGNIENFFAAMEAGADAVYVGAPGFNARNMARELRLEEIGAMINYCRSEDKKIYIAANSLVLENEIPPVIKSLALLERLEPDALIVQDLGIINLVKRNFPDLPLHASTLMTAHNSESVDFFKKLGCERVVLARELTLKEIVAIRARCPETELEVFVHGAMCFSYSGQCLFSSYLGGKSGLRGRCVQPCRRSYSSGGTGKKQQGKKRSGGYIFSMNDLSGLEALPALAEAGVSSLKIEGRLRSANYVKQVVKAYRTVLDATPETMQEALVEANSLADQAMGRKRTSGYFFSPQPAEAITVFHSGNMGAHLGRFSIVKMVGEENVGRFKLKFPLTVGDRLRLHTEPSGERVAFRLKKLFVGGEEKEHAAVGSKISITLPPDIAVLPGGHVEVYKVDGGVPQKLPNRPQLHINQSKKQLASISQELAKEIETIQENVCRGDEYLEGKEPVKRHISQRRKTKKRDSRDIPIDWWLKTDSIKSIESQMAFQPKRFILTFEKQLVGQAGQIKRYLGRNMKKVTWALPPLIMENDLPRYKKQIKLLIRTGFRSFQLGHVSQYQLFASEKVQLLADYTINLMNNRALDLVARLGFEGAQVAIEMDKSSLADLIAGYRGIAREVTAGEQRRKFEIGLTVYGAPALYTSRLASDHFNFEKIVTSPKDEQFTVRKKEGYTQTFPQKPFSLLPYLGELKELGVGYAVVDITGVRTGKKDMDELEQRLVSSGKYVKLPTFNYLGKLL